MRRVLTIILILFLLSSCQTKGPQEMSQREKEEAAEYLIESIQSALIETENTLFRGSYESIYTLPSTYDFYLGELTQFKVIAGEYLQAAEDLLAEALVPVTDFMYTNVSGRAITDPAYYLEVGYFSLSMELEEELREDVGKLFLSYLEEHSSSLDVIYQRAERETRIWRDNLANLSMVGQGREAEEIEPIDLSALASNAAEIYFDALSQSEVEVRSLGGR